MREHVFVHDSNHKGNVAEAEIAAAGVNLGIPVLEWWRECEVFISA